MDKYISSEIKGQKGYRELSAEVKSIISKNREIALEILHKFCISMGQAAEFFDILSDGNDVWISYSIAIPGDPKQTIQLRNMLNFFQLNFLLSLRVIVM